MKECCSIVLEGGSVEKTEGGKRVEKSKDRILDGDMLPKFE